MAQKGEDLLECEVCRVSPSHVMDYCMKYYVAAAELARLVVVLHHDAQGRCFMFRVSSIVVIQVVTVTINH